MTSQYVIKKTAMVSREAIGAKLRIIRREKGLTLKALSQMCGVPISTLSKTELGQTALSYDKLTAISFALNVEMATLLQASSQPMHSPALAGQVLKGSLAEHEDYITENYQHKFLFSEISGKSMTPIIATIFSREVTDFKEFIKHPGQEFTVVLSGSIKIVFENGNEIELHEKETVYFDSSVGHVYLSLSAEPARVLTVCSDI